MAEILTFVIILLLGAFAEEVFTQDPQRCFSRFGNCDIIYSNPYRKIWRVDNTSCLQQCAVDQPVCKGVVYDVTFSICNLYPFSGNSGPGFLIPAYKKVYYQINDTSCLGTITAGPVTTTTAGPIIILPTQTNPPITRPTRRPTRPPPPVRTVTFGTLPPFIPEKTKTKPAAEGTLPPFAGRGRALANFAKTTNASNGGCPDGKQPVYLGLMETNVITPPDETDGPISTNIGDPSTCIKACSLNQDPNGKQIDCQSFTYNSVDQKCTFHAFTPMPDGSAKTSTVAGMNSFVKACVSGKPENSKCKNAMLITAPGVELRGHVQKSLNGVKSLVECLDNCLNDESCKSLNYYHKAAGCYLHHTDSSAAPDAIGAAKSDDAIYVENTCGGAGRKTAQIAPETINRFGIQASTQSVSVQPTPSKEQKSSKQKDRKSVLKTKLKSLFGQNGQHI